LVFHLEGIYNLFEYSKVYGCDVIDENVGEKLLGSIEKQFAKYANSFEPDCNSLIETITIAPRNLSDRRVPSRDSASV
jgi:hypothetical protein